jgi:hypothetical protein
MIYYCPTCKEEIPPGQVDDEEHTDDGHTVYDFRHAVEGEVVNGKWRARYHGVELHSDGVSALEEEQRREMEVDKEIDRRLGK